MFSETRHALLRNPTLISMSTASPLKRHAAIEIVVLVVSLVSLATATVLVWWLVKAYPDQVSNILKPMKVPVWLLALIATVAFCTLCMRGTRSVGYSLGTLILLEPAVICYLFWQRWPDYLVSLFGWEVMTGTACILTAALVAVWIGAQLAERWIWLVGAEATHVALTKAQDEIDAEKAIVSNKAEAITNLKNRCDGLVVQIQESESKRNAEAQKARDREKQNEQRRLYEAQFVGGFLVAVGFRFAQARYTQSMSINYVQGGRDAALADLISATAGRFWLIEFKRGEAELGDEFTKRTRKQQMHELQKDTTLAALADRCHFIGWGAHRSTGHQLFFSRYLDLWRTPNHFSPSWLIQTDDFLSHAIPDRGKIATIGVAASEFQKYLQMLEYWGGSATGDDDFAALVMYQDSLGALRYFIEPSFAIFMEAVSLAHQVAAQKEQLRRIEHDNKGPSPRNGPLPGF